MDDGVVAVVLADGAAQQIQPRGRHQCLPVPPHQVPGQHVQPLGHLTKAQTVGLPDSREDPAGHLGAFMAVTGPVNVQVKQNGPPPEGMYQNDIYILNT